MDTGAARADRADKVVKNYRNSNNLACDPVSAETARKTRSAWSEQAGDA